MTILKMLVLEFYSSIFRSLSISSLNISSATNSTKKNIKNQHLDEFVLLWIYIITTSVHKYIISFFFF